MHVTQNVVSNKQKKKCKVTYSTHGRIAKTKAKSQNKHKRVNKIKPVRTFFPCIVAGIIENQERFDQLFSIGNCNQDVEIT